MAEQDFLVWAPSGGEVMSQADYLANAALANGVAAGIADPLLFNKSMRQATLMAAILAKFIQQETPAQTVIDDGTTATILASLTSALRTLLVNQGGGPGQAAGHIINLGWDGTDFRIALDGVDKNRLIRTASNAHSILLDWDGTSITATVDGTSEGELVRASQFSRSISALDNGVVQFPGGSGATAPTLMQVFSATIFLSPPGPTTTTIAFPVAFPTACDFAMAGFFGLTPALGDAAAAAIVSRTQVDITGASNNASLGVLCYAWGH